MLKCRARQTSIRSLLRAVALLATSPLRSLERQRESKVKQNAMTSASAQIQSPDLRVFLLSIGVVNNVLISEEKRSLHTRRWYYPHTYLMVSS